MDQTNHTAETSTRNADTATLSRRDILLTAGAAAATGLLGGCTAQETTVGSPADCSPLVPVNLRCEHLVNPMGVDESTPRLSWHLHCGDVTLRGLCQTAWRVQVASSLEKFIGPDLWDSGIVISSATNLNSDMASHYAGQPLSSHQCCFWRVQVTDAQGRVSPWSDVASWTMGFLSDTDWKAQWITDAVLADPKNLPRVPINCYRSEIADRPDAAKWIVLDLGKSRMMDGVELAPSRPAFLSTDYTSFLYPVRFCVEVASHADFRDARRVVDQSHTDIPSPRPPAIPAPRFNFSPVKARFVRLTVTQLAYWDCRYWAFSLGGFSVYSKGTDVAVGAAVSCFDSVETGTVSKRFLTTGKFEVAFEPAPPGDPWRPLDHFVSPQTWNIATPPDLVVKVDGMPYGDTILRVPMLRRDFYLDAPVKRAMLYITARGFHEMSINGRRVSESQLAPGFTEFNKRVLYDVHDVTSLLHQGNNAIGALLAYGWYAGHMNLFNMCYIFGYMPKLLAQLEIHLANDRQITITTDEYWKSTLDGPIRYSDLLNGECQDLRKTISGWDQPGFDASGWRNVYTLPMDDAKISWHLCQPARRQTTIRPVSRSEISPGVYRYDFGQEFAGYCRLSVTGPADTHITLHHAECLLDNGSLDKLNLWDALQRDDVFLRGEGREIFEPHFTYHGFRYVEVRGLPNPPDADTLIGVPVRTDLATTSAFACSNPLWNKLMKAVRWTQWNLLFDIPAGCAARAERLGWLGDIRDCLPTAMLNMDGAAFFSKYLQDSRDSQRPEGQFCDITPHAQLRGTDLVAGSPGWADAGVIMAWDLYVATGDKDILEKQFSAMERWVNFVHSHNPNGLWLNNLGENWGDWLSAGTPVTPKDLAATAYFARSTDYLARSAGVLGKSAEARKYTVLFENIRRAFTAKYVKRDGSITGDAQGSYALALEFNLLDEPRASKALDKLVAAIERNNGHLATGFLSTRALAECLSRLGRHEVASRMVNQVTRPSWGYMVDTIGTTFWESFNAYIKGHAVTLSLCHWPWSSIGEWMWRYVAGLNVDDNAPGWSHFSVRPRPTPEVRWCRARYQSPRGEIAIHWRMYRKRLELDLTVPMNTSAMVYLPAANQRHVMEGGRPLSDAPGVSLIDRRDGMVVAEIQGGGYQFVCT